MRQNDDRAHISIYMVWRQMYRRSYSVSKWYPDTLRCFVGVTGNVISFERLSQRGLQAVGSESSCKSDEKGK